MQEVTLTENQPVRLNSTDLRGILVALSQDRRSAFVRFNDAQLPVEQLTPLTDEESLETGIFCSFCGKGQKRVKQLVAGRGAYICNECVVICVEIFLFPEREYVLPKQHESSEPAKAPAQQKRSTNTKKKLERKQEATPSAAPATGEE